MIKAFEEATDIESDCAAVTKFPNCVHGIQRKVDVALAATTWVRDPPICKNTVTEVQFLEPGFEWS
ncbi:hypothetical protein ACOJBO_21145 [Rhizobium beringeri]